MAFDRALDSARRKRLQELFEKDPKDLTEAEEDLLAQEHLRVRANYSLAILEKSFIRHGSGRYFVLRQTS